MKSNFTKRSPKAAPTMPTTTPRARPKYAASAAMLDRLADLHLQHGLRADAERLAHNAVALREAAR